MVNNAGETGRRNKNGEKHETERQKLADELSFLAGLISKHKEKPVTRNDQNVVGFRTNQFSWTKQEQSSSSQSSTSSFLKQGQRLHNPQYLPMKESLTWKKPKERSEGHFTTPANRYKYVAKDVQRLKVGTAIKRNKNVSSAKYEASVCNVEKTSVATSSGQHPVPNQDVQTRRIVIPQQGNNLLPKSKPTPSEISKAGLPSRKPTSAKSEVIDKSDSSEPDLASRRTISVNPKLQNSSSELQRRGNNRRVVLPTSQKASVLGALKSVVNLDALQGLSRNKAKDNITAKPSASFSKAQTCNSSKGIFPDQQPGILQYQKESTERPNAKVLATLSKELDKCLGDIARLKGARAQLKHGQSATSVSVVKAPCVSRSQTSSEVNSDTNQGSTCILKPNSANKKHRETELEKSTTGSCAIAAKSDYKWVAPVKEIGNTKVKSAKTTVHNEAEIRTGTNTLNTGLKTLRPSLHVNVIRTKYKMKKQLSTPSSIASSSVSRHKIDHRKAVVTPAVKASVKSYTQKCSGKINRYKLVKSSSHSGVVSVGQPSTSSSSPQKMQVAVNSRYKKVKGYPTASGSPKKSAIVIPHRSQLRLNRTKPKPHQRNSTKQASSAITTRKPSRHKIDRRPGRTSVVRSRFKMRKVSNSTPRKTPPKQSSDLSPFKWQAKKLTPPKSATPDTFMRRRMRFVLTHTPVLLRTRFRLINSQQNNSTLVIGPKQPLLKKTRTKLVRKSASTPSSPSQKHSRSRVVNAKGVHYHQSRSGKSLRRISGSSPVLPSSTSRFMQGSLSRVWTASAHKVYQRQGVTRVSSTQWVANRVLRRTIQGKIQRGNKNVKSQPYCKFYNRYGRCHREDKCPYIHDPDKVAVCTQFLRGTCKKTNGSCPFSHKVSKDKMPVCVYFLKGVCNRDDCPYSHVKVSKKAEVCQEFLHGYCPRGAKCKKKHTLDCAEFNETGRCKLGNQCPLWHRGRKAKSEGRKGVKRRTSEGENVTSKRLNARDKLDDKSKGDASLSEESCSKKDDNADTSASDGRSGSMPSFIALDSDSNQSTPEDSMMKKIQPFGEDGGRPALKIRPLFAPSMGATTSHQGQGRDSSTSKSSLLKP